MCNWVHLLGVHSQNMSFDEDDSEVNMTVSDGSENAVTISTVPMSCMNLLSG